MKRVLTITLLAVACLLSTGANTAEAHFGFRFGFGHRHFGHVGYWPRRSFHVGHWGHRHWGWGHRHWGWGHRHWGWGYRPVYRSYYYPRTFIYSRPIYPSYGWGCASTSVVTPGIVAAPVAPVYADASRAYGPDAVKEFIGVDRDFGKGPLVAPPLVVNVDGVDAGERIVRAPIEEKESIASNAEARARAARFVSFGDDKFGAQEYHGAAQRYRFAIEAAPEVADAHFRQGFAYVASNRYELAVKAFRRGLELDPVFVNSSFHVDDIYARNTLAKDSHLDALAKSALIDRGNADHFFLVGVVLHFDGQQERAKKFFQRADKLAGGNDAHIQAFLNPAPARAEDAI